MLTVSDVQRILRVMEKKRKQHYVWEHYLDGWATEGRIWCRRAGRVFPTSTENVGQSRDFYRLRELSERDVRVVKELIVDRTDGAQREVHLEWLELFTAPYQLKRSYDAGPVRSEALDHQLDVMINNIEEDLHAMIEGQSTRFLIALREGDLAFVSNRDDMASFTLYLAFQYMRTPRVMRRSVDATAGIIPHFDSEAAWGVMRTMFATNIGAALFAAREGLRITLLQSDPTLTFITGDQPAINTAAVGLAPGEQTEKLELYYPVSPELAVLISAQHATPGVGRRQINRQQTKEYNEMIATMSDEQLYAGSEQALQ